MPIAAPAQYQPLDYDALVAEHGEWTAMAVHLGQGKYTRRAAPDWRLRRLTQVIDDVLGKPLSEARVLIWRVLRATTHSR